MAREYLKVFAALGVAVDVVGRDPRRATLVGGEFGVEARGGGIEALSDLSAYAGVVVATGISELAAATVAVLERGAKFLLVEKPGALYRAELEMVAEHAKDARIWVAFNRRFFPSVDFVRRAAADDGGSLSGTFDFTEMAGRVLPVMGERPDAPQLLARLGITNSIHVIDLFLHLAGVPAEWAYWQGGSLPWHPSGSVFCGAGTTEADVYFSYSAAWSGAGRWGIELTTPLRRFVLRPLEEVKVQSRDSFAVERVEIAGEAEGLKPGVPSMVRAFLHAIDGGSDDRLAPLEEALRHYAVVETMLGYA